MVAATRWVSSRWALLGVAAVSLAVRASDLTDSLWADEVFSWAVSSQDLASILAFPEQTPPLHHVLLHASIAMLGDAEWALRLPSALAGAGTAALAVIVARRWMKGEWALVAGLLVAVHPPLVLLGQEARSYAFLAFFGAASWWLWLQAWDGRRGWTVAGYIASAAAMLYTHVFGLFFLAAQAFAWVMVRPRRLAFVEAAGLQAGPLALFVFWLGILVDRTQYVASGFWIQPSDLSSLTSTILLFAGANVLLVLHAGVWLAGILRRTAALAGPGNLVASIWAALPAVVPYALSFAFPIYTPRYAVPAAVGYLVLVAGAVGRLPRRVAWGAAGLTLVASLILALQIIPGANDDAVRTDWRGGIAFVEANAVPGDAVVFWPGYCDSLANELSCPWSYYGTRPDLELVGFGPSNSGATPTTCAHVQDRLAGSDRAWLMEIPASTGSTPAATCLAGNFDRADSIMFDKLQVARYERPTAASAAPRSR